MALRPQRTLGELRDELARKLGFGAQLSALGHLDEVLKGFLRDSQLQLWWQHRFPELWREYEVATGAGQVVYDYPDDCDPLRIFGVWIKVSGIWSELHEGITPLHRSDPITHAWPLRFLLREQLEVWPPPETTAYTLRIEYQAYPERFDADTDRASLYDELVLMHAIADGKNQYEHADADRYEAKMRALLGKLNAGATRHERNIAVQVTSPERRPPVRPVTIDERFS